MWKPSRPVKLCGVPYVDIIDETNGDLDGPVCCVEGKGALRFAKRVCAALNAMESRPTGRRKAPVQQLQAEIAARIPKIECAFNDGDEFAFEKLLNELRQLSAM